MSRKYWYCVISALLYAHPVSSLRAPWQWSVHEPRRSTVSSVLLGRLGKCWFNPQWRRILKYDSEAHCHKCRKTFKMGTVGLTAWTPTWRAWNTLLEPQPTSSKHPRHSSVLSNTLALNKVSNTGIATATASNTEEIAVSTAQPVNLQAYCGSTPSLRSAVLWILKTVSDHHPYTSNDETGTIFKWCFLTLKWQPPLWHT